MPFLYFFHNVTDMLIFVYDRESISHFLTSRKRFTRGRCQGVTLFKLQYLRRVIITHSRGGDFDVERGVNALFKIRLSLSLPSHLPAFVCVSLVTGYMSSSLDLRQTLQEPTQLNTCIFVVIKSCCTSSLRGFRQNKM
jgi:hypothetical protein